MYVVTGAGGAPGASNPFSQPAPFIRKTLNDWSYGRVTVWNASHLTYTHIRNNDSAVVDEWTIVQPNHGPFARKARSRRSINQ